MINIKTYTVTISLGLKEGYDGVQHNVQEVIDFCKEYCNKVHLCVTVTPTHFCYVDGDEDGCFIGLIQYPRFPKEENEIESIAVNMATQLKDRFNQNRVSVIFPDCTYLL